MTEYAQETYPKSKPGPKPDTLVIECRWGGAMKKSLGKKKTGWRLAEVK